MSENIEISSFGNNLIFKDNYTVEFVKSILIKKKLNGLKITRWTNNESLDFLNDYTFLESLDITGGKDFNFKFLKNLTNLKSLSISIVGKETIDLSSLQNLENLTIYWRKKKIKGLDKCQNLKILCLVNFGEPNLSSISDLKELTSLQIKTSSIQDLRGIENLNNLSYLLLGDCKKLNQLQYLSSLKNLKSLHFEYCSKILDFDEVGNLKKLESLKIDDCKQINSIKFLESLINLRKLTVLGNSDIFDGDLIPTLKIAEVFYKHRKHYNIKIENKSYNMLVNKNLEKISFITNLNQMLSNKKDK